MPSFFSGALRAHTSTTLHGPVVVCGPDRMWGVYHGRWPAVLVASVGGETGAWRSRRPGRRAIFESGRYWWNSGLGVRPPIGVTVVYEAMSPPNGTDGD